jgi:hypothetical protein
MNASKWLRRTARDFLGFVLGEGRSGIPGGLTAYDVRVPWLHDRYGNQWCLSCRCAACGARRSLVFPVRRMAMHIERTHR